MSKTKKRIKQKTVTLSQPNNRWDMGPTTVAQMAGKVIENAAWTDADGNKVNPNGVKRARRIDLAESYHKRTNNQLLNERQFKAAVHIRDTFENTQRTAPAIKAIQVDSTPKPDQHVAILMDRISKYSDVMRRVPSESIKVVEAVAIDNRAIGHLKQYRGRRHAIGVRLLQEGLNAVADHMQY